MKSKSNIKPLFDNCLIRPLKAENKTAGGIYGLGFLGAAVYYIQQATGFWEGVVGVLKAIVWPAFVVYKLLGL